MTTEYICPIHNGPGTKHARRNGCVVCIREQHRKMWHEKKARSVDGSEIVGSQAAGGWQASMASDYLRKSLMVNLCG